MRFYYLFTALISATLMPFQIVSAEGSSSERVIMVLDASGSMWGQIKSRPKIDIAKEVVRDLVADWDPNVELGLVVYGHREKGDCADIESVVPLGALDKEKFNSKLSRISPKGKTPLSDAVVKAAEELRYTEEKATVILVSDGIETCNQDPCAIATKLNEAGVDFTTHVIGFDITKQEEKAQLECLAKNTGGEFFSAGDAKSLKAALSKAVEKTVQLKGLTFFAVMNEGGERLKKGIAWEVFKADADAFGKRERVTYTYDSVARLHLPAGQYLVKAKKGNATAEKEIQVEKGVPAEHQFVFGAGRIKLMAKMTEDGEAIDKVSWKVFPAVQDDFNKPKSVAYSYDKEPLFTLPAGSYLVSVKRGDSTAEKEIEVIAGKDTTDFIVLGSGQLKMQARMTEEGAPLDKVALKKSADYSISTSTFC